MPELNRLQHIVFEKDISYRDLERKSGISHSQIRKIANFQTIPTQTTMIAIARGLKMDVDQIFNLNWMEF